MTEQKQILKQTAHKAVVRTIIFFSRFLRLFILGRNLTPAEYGVYALIGSFTTTAHYFLGLGFHNYLIRKVPGKPFKESIGLFKTLITFEIILTSVVLCFIFFTPIYNFLIIKFNLSEYRSIFRLICPMILMILIDMELIRFFNSLRRIEIGNWLEFFMQAGWVYILGAVLIIRGGVRLEDVIFCWLSGLLICASFGFLKTGPRDFINASFNQTYLKEAMFFGLPLLMSGMGTQLIHISDRYILSYFKGVETVGIYSYAYIFINIVYLFIVTLSIAVIRPYIIAATNTGRLEDKKKYLSFAFKYAFILFGLSAFLLLTLGQDAIHFMAKRQYITSVTLFPYLIFIPLANILMFPLNLEMFLRNRVFIIALNTLLAAVLNIVLNILLIPKFSIYGAAVATIFSQIFLILLFVSFLKKDVLEILDFKKIKLVSIFCSIGLASVIFVMLRKLILWKANLWDLILQGGLFLIIFGVFLFVCRAFTESEKRVMSVYLKKYFTKA